MSRILFYLSNTMLSVAVGWHVYDISNSPKDLGLVGLATFLPKLLFSFVGGDLADRFDRLRILRTGLFTVSLCVSFLAYITYSETRNLLGIFMAISLISAVSATTGPSGTALIPHLVSSQNLSRAIAWGSSFWQGTAIAGPALGGLIYAAGQGPFAVYLSCSIAVFGAFLFSLFIHPTSHPRATQGTMLERVAEGAHYVHQHKILLGAISLDLFAVLLGGAVALMPIYARDILHLGPRGLGLLRCAPALGAAAMAITLGLSPIRRQAGKKMFIAVAIFGCATCLFALSTKIWISLFALTILGAADMISVVIRQTLVQLKTPGEMRGRVSALSQIFIGASNELGEFESGLTAYYFGVVPAALFGGLGTLAVVFAWIKIFPELLHADRIDD